MERNYTLITGGTDGIGFELAKVFAANGHNLIIVARNEDELSATKASLSSHGVDIITIPVNLFDEEAPFQLFKQVNDQDLSVDILVNNAGQGQYGLFAESDIRRQMEIVRLNCGSLIALTHLFIQQMLQRGEGKILNLSSIASKVPGPWQAVYHATKAFVQSFTEALRSEVKEHNITVTALLPGATDTDFFNKADMNSSKAVQDKDKLADPAKVAKDGYDALMDGDDKVVSGLKNKVTVAMSNMMPDSTNANMMKKQQEPVNEKK